jgi:hypothetical protein
LIVEGIRCKVKGKRRKAQGAGSEVGRISYGGQVEGVESGLSEGSGQNAEELELRSG